MREQRGRTRPGDNKTSLGERGEPVTNPTNRLSLAGIKPSLSHVNGLTYKYTGIEMITCKCGSKLFTENTWCQGWWKALIDEHGETVDTNLDHLKYRPTPKTVKCVECGKVNPNPRLNKH